MTQAEKELIQQIDSKLPWHEKYDMPIAKEFVLCDTEYGWFADFAINMALGWSAVIRWVYRSEIIAMMSEEEKKRFNTDRYDLRRVTETVEGD